MRVESAAGMGKASSDHPEARLGEVVRGKWTLEAVLGTGGMAAVYVARHTIGRREAIKILHPEVARDPEQRKRFDQEARAANQLGHPGAVEVRDVDVTDDGCPFMVMELLEGETLGDLANRQDGLPLDDLLRFTDETLDVLAAAHARGIVHRDIKLGNLFLTKEGRIKVLDFGIARVSSSHITRAGARLGTTAYMPPEQIRGEQVDGRADLFAVGATMFRILAKRRVHEAKTEVDLIAKMAMTPAPMLATVCQAPAGVCLVVDRALAFRVAERYPDARTMQLDVQALRRGEAPPYASSSAPKSTVIPGATRAEGTPRKAIDSNAATVAPPRAELATAPIIAPPASRLGFEPTGISSDDAPAAPESVRIHVTPSGRGADPTGLGSAPTIVPTRQPLVGFEPTAASARNPDGGPPKVVPSRVVGSATPTAPSAFVPPPASAAAPFGPSSMSGALPTPHPTPPAQLPPVSSGTPSAMVAHAAAADAPPASAWGVPPAGSAPAKRGIHPGLVVAIAGVILGGIATALVLAFAGDDADTRRETPSSATAPQQPVAPGVAPAPTVVPPGAKKPAPAPAPPPQKPGTPPKSSAPGAPPVPPPPAPSAPAPPPPPASTPIAPPPPPASSPATPPGPPRGKPPKGGKGRGKDDKDD